MLNIVMVASECTPFFKTGGLADVIGSLPQELARNKKIETTVILPKHSKLPEEYEKELEFVGSFSVNVTWRNQHCGLFKIKQSDVTYYFIDNEYYFKRDSLYGHFDDAERYVFFTHAVLASIDYLNLDPSILHCHDWQTGLIPAYIKAGRHSKLVKTLFTIHNLRYQGIFSFSIFHELLHLDETHIGGLMMGDSVNFLKAALIHADWVSTVSPTYAMEIKTPHFGEGLHTILNERSSTLTGIINGIDTNDFNPATDKALPFNYSHDLDKKRKNKRYIQEKYNLNISDSTPMVTIISRLVSEKGLPLILHILEELLQTEDVQLTILGTGDLEFEQAFKYFKNKFPDKMHVELAFDESLARTFYAASDMFLMPSQFEPCGLSQLIALRYESVPIVRETGGLNDTILSYNEETGEGNGFSFTNFNADDLLYTIRRALSLYQDKKMWVEICHNVYQSDFSWTESAKTYMNLYEKLIE
ncbi:glycogen synthase GlgA [Bacillus solitudinis]|uniref:glycogen synthase GlgA n=1 Tax=Bacillus solitudinis TaxID=2014074 RepID=UPI0029DE8ABA|nr:glycogen synthase GlgA [Bacillus solitudinis]